MIEATIIADSVNPVGVRLTTYICKYPRFIHSEVMTHRALSKNASSSRAIPVEKMIELSNKEPAEPIHWGANQKGMQAGTELSKEKVNDCWHYWMQAREYSVACVRKMIEAGLHKQVENRLLEPWSHMTTLISGTEWANFFALRVHPDAQPEFQELAYQMLKLYVHNKPNDISEDGWHVPFYEHHLSDACDGNIDKSIKACIGRCARVSYKNQNGDYNLQDDLALYERIANHRPLHATPMEHVAQAGNHDKFIGNFRGWTQYRKILKDENIEIMDFKKHLEQYELSRQSI